jgi:uncharacterized membrane protein YeaQ/YmgE (transglycosylase-associated protein family)
MTMSLPELLLLVVIAAVCGAIGKAIAGSVRGGLIVSIALGFVGALLGPWVARLLKLPEPLMVTVGGHPFRGAPRLSSFRSSAGRNDDSGVGLAAGASPREQRHPGRR